ncbi:MAG: FGGY family carbohydrate kinase [Dongiaceae bacterium]
MESGLYLGIDHGGSTTTALLLDPESRTHRAKSVPMPKAIPQIGWVEHDPEDFLRTSVAAAGAVLADAGRGWRDVAGLCIADQGETSMAWSTEGRALGPAISWEDRRTVETCNALGAKGLDVLVRERTGVLLDPYFSASKFRWLLDNVPAISEANRSGTLRFGGTDSYVIDRLTGGAIHATDRATASRTALMNIRSTEWDDALLGGFGLDRKAMPALMPTCADYGTIAASRIGISGVPITANAVDAHAALFAQGCHDPGIVKATYGTGAFIEVNTGRRMLEPDGKLPVFVAWQLSPEVDYTIEGGVFAVGSAIDWAVAAGLLASASESAELAKSVPDSGGVTIVPSLTGLSAPYWKPTARGCIFGLGLDTGPGHLARALLDGIAFQCAEIVQAIDARLDGSIREIRADGGPTKNDYLMQRQADLLGVPMAVSLEPDMTALGAAMLAAIGGGGFNLDDAMTFSPPRRQFDPSIDRDRCEAMWQEWRRCVATACERAEG